MKSKGNIVFLGMMGSGKTSIGELVSKKLDLNFFDVDQYIEDETKMKISKIFSKEGETFFRELEEKKTLNLLNKKNSVISLGGGAFLNQKIREEVLKNHLSFWLNLSTEAIMSRIKNSSKRPIATKLTTDELRILIKKRSNIYSKAMYKIECDGLTKKEVVDKIINIYETN